MTKMDNTTASMRTHRTLRGVGVALIAAATAGLVPGHAARAQLLDQITNPNIPGVSVEPGVTVLSRKREEYDFRGIRAGGFMIRPQVIESLGYDDNVTASHQRHGSPIVQSSGGLLVQSDWSGSSLEGAFVVDDTRYLDLSRQSYTNWLASVGGTYDIGRDTAALAFTHQNLNQTPGGLDSPQLTSAIAYRIDTVRAGYNITFNRVALRPDVSVAAYSFDNGTVAGKPYVQSYRNRTVVTPGVLVSYEVAPRRNVVAVVRNAVATYVTPPVGTALRNYNDTRILTGVDYDGGGLWRARALVGYEIRTFSNKALKTVQEPTAEANIVFNPSGLTTLTATLSRQIADSADEITTSFTETALNLSVDHEYLRNVLLRGQVGVASNSYGSGQGTQTLYSAGVSATWLLNRNARLSLSYNVTARDSKASGTLGTTTPQAFGGNYTENRYLLRLSVGL